MILATKLCRTTSFDVKYLKATSVSFFKKVYKTYTNFSMESMKVIFNKNFIQFNESTKLIAKIPRNADLVQEIYFSFELPNGVSTT